MIGRRQRIVFYFERQQTLQEIKKLTGKSVELIAASDTATIEAAIRLYSQINVIIAERSGLTSPALALLQFAESNKPNINRVMFAGSCAMTGVYEAMHTGTINALLFCPSTTEQICDALGLQTVATPVAAGAMNRQIGRLASSPS